MKLSEPLHGSQLILSRWDLQSSATLRLLKVGVLQLCQILASIIYICDLKKGGI